MAITLIAYVAVFNTIRIEKLIIQVAVYVKTVLSPPFHSSFLTQPQYIFPNESEFVDISFPTATYFLSDLYLSLHRRLFLELLIPKMQVSNQQLLRLFTRDGDFGSFEPLILGSKGNVIFPLTVCHYQKQLEVKVDKSPFLMFCPFESL